MIGKTLDGRYRLDRIIGQGGMGAVYEATHVGTGRLVAVKLIQQIALGDTDVFARFQREARASSSVDTRHIVEVLDSGRDPESGLPFMAMEMLKGEDVGGFVERRGAMSQSLALRVVAQACVGLGKAHHAHVVHRDIKPANLFLTEEEDDEVIVKLLDFGIAKVRPKTPLEGEGLALTQTGRLLGTPLYMSPEQAQGMKDIDHRTDIWSLGAVLFEALTAHPPFDAENLGKLILAICSKPVRLPSTLVPSIPPALDAIVAKAMKLEREERYESAEAFLDDLVAHLPDGYGIALHEVFGGDGPPVAPRRAGGSGNRSSAVRASGRASRPGPSVRVTPSPRDPQELVETQAADEVGVASTLYASVGALPSPQRRRRRIGAAALGGVLLVGAVGFWLHGRGSADRAAAPQNASAAQTSTEAVTSRAPVPAPSIASPASSSPASSADVPAAAPSASPTTSAAVSTSSRVASPRTDTSTKRPAASATAPPAASIQYENKFQ